MSFIGDKTENPEEFLRKLGKCHEATEVPDDLWLEAKVFKKNDGFYFSLPQAFFGSK